MAERRFKRNSTSKKSTTVNTLICRRPLIIFITEDKVQKTVYKLNQIMTEHCLTISANKTQIMALKERHPVRI